MRRKRKLFSLIHKKNRKEFSKVLLIQESALIWIMTLSFLGLAALCILKNYTGSLPWLTAMISLPWAAYGVSQCFYYNKSKEENTVGGIKYETVLRNYEIQAEEEEEASYDDDYII
jgi:hypothetical protein